MARTPSQTGRNFEELEAQGLRSWPAEIAEQERASSIIPRMLETQETFISLLHVANRSPSAWKPALVATTDLPGNLFLKHLMVLADVSGEKLKNHLKEFRTAFVDGIMRFTWNGQEHSYRLQSPREKWDNPRLNVDGNGLSSEQAMSPAMEDVAMLILFGGSSTAGLPDWVQERCVIGQMLGHREELERFVRDRYIWVSRITGGATANQLGQLAQGHVRNFLKQRLRNWNFSRHTVAGITHNAGGTDMSFDIVGASRQGLCCAVEVSFQVTTNSVIERKAGQAEARQRLLHARGHRIAYVIDGAGNFYRKPALRTICRFSDCTVTFKHEELEALVQYLRTLT